MCVALDVITGLRKEVAHAQKLLGMMHIELVNERAGMQTIIAEKAELCKQLAEAIKERDHWKANHDNQKEIKRAVLDRPDLAERAALVQKLIRVRDAMTERVYREAKQCPLFGEHKSMPCPCGYPTPVQQAEIDVLKDA
jgi:hypothetical protein